MVKARSGMQVKLVIPKNPIAVTDLARKHFLREFAEEVLKYFSTERECYTGRR